MCHSVIRCVQTSPYASNFATFTPLLPQHLYSETLAEKKVDIMPTALL